MVARRKKINAGAKPPASGKRKHEKKSLPPITTKTSDGQSRRMSLVPLLPRFRCLHDFHSSRTFEKIEVSWCLAGREQPMQIDQALAGST
jgi:hypothetical protein